MSYLELTRVSGIFTAVSNVLLGYFLSYNGEDPFPSLLYLRTATSLLYCGGMALNDFFDFKSDVKEHPKRVIPSGRMKRRDAGIFGFSAVLVACIVASFAGMTSFAIAILISVLIVVYNRFAKDVLILGALNMATIRFFNVILGSSTTAVNELVIASASAIFIFVFGITLMSRKEDDLLRKYTAPRLGMVGAVVAYVLVLHITGVLTGEYIVLFVILFAALALLPYRMKSAKVAQLVGSSVIAIILLDATLISGTGQILFAFAVALLYIPSFALSRVIKVS
ncbi:MAG: UbiA family prenyltransferase [Nitrososphaerales archaeon]